MARTAAVIMTLLALAGCATPEDRPLDLFGKARAGSERFRGTATIFPNGSTSVKMVSVAGVECVGEFPYAGREKSAGQLICTDGRTASVAFTALTGTSGYGYGTTSDQTDIAFFFGLPEAEADAYLGVSPPAQ